ncbi:Heavy-metal resistance [Desulfonatronum thiosulfatophilum]|uniref:Heavy-metal resistance n=1 Tax=Desulfonatronum thiosulfatophilum TaxID=617002 RepID=A0A1G6DBN8_9BACT|nr:periplasmic heavy metal sensor [Desulfonatronum thiosulfatophilum]SDB42577.1 Heavy-metal resistance [Desulfonatronum thiosulfatophilum]
MRKISTISTAVLIIALLSFPVLAQHDHGAEPSEGQITDAHPVHGTLTEEQRQAVRNMVESHRQEVMHHNLRMRAKQAELDVLLASPEVNQEAINSVTEEITQLHGETLRMKNNLRRAIYEETGHLIRSGTLGGKGRGMGGRGMRSGMGSMDKCPMMSGHSDH